MVCTVDPLVPIEINGRVEAYANDSVRGEPKSDSVTIFITAFANELVGLSMAFI